MSTARSSRGKALGINTHTAGGVNPDVECMSHGHVSVEYESMLPDSMPKQLSQHGLSLHNFSLSEQHRKLRDTFGKEIIWNLLEPVFEEAEVQQNEALSSTLENMLSLWPWPCAQTCIPLG